MSKQIQDAYIVTADPQEDLGNVIVGLAAALGVFAIGVGASWVLATMVYDGYRAQKWVGVEGTANWFGTGRVAYQYKFGDVQYFGDRLDPNPTIFTSSIDSPPADHAPMRPPTYRDDTPVAIWVNPDNPSESMMNRNVPWGFAIVTTLFALTFGVGGFAATWALSRKIFGRREVPVMRAVPTRDRAVILPGEEKFVRRYPGHEPELRKWVESMPPALRAREMLAHRESPLGRAYPLIIFGLGAAIIIGVWLMILFDRAGR
ncbi:MAG: DUF3592 domain-containing protein [Pseudomonadota bacterium]|nr:DUF3592 domain-containing protein [Pseudomonadota bacterium]